MPSRSWIAKHADILDYPDAGNPFRQDIKVDAPDETTVRLEAVTLGILPGCRFYEFAGQLFRVDQDGALAGYQPGGWQPIEGATLRTELAVEITPAAARAAVEASREGGGH